MQLPSIVHNAELRGVMQVLWGSVDLMTSWLASRTWCLQTNMFLFDYYNLLSAHTIILIIIYYYSIMHAVDVISEK